MMEKRMDRLQQNSLLLLSGWLKVQLMLAVFTSFLFPIISHSQKTTNSPYFLSFSGQYGKFQVHTKSLSPFNGTHPKGAELELSRLFYTPEIHSQCGCYAKLGVGLNYVDFDHSELGQGLTAVFYVEPFFKAKGKLRFSLKGGTGIAWLSNPYDENTNPENLTYSSNLSFPLFIGFSSYYFFNPSWAIKNTIAFQHLSNGGIKQPKLGINYPTISLGLEYALQPYRIPSVPIPKPFTKENQTTIELGFTLKEDTTDTNNRLLISLRPNRSHQLSRINAITYGLLLEYEQQDAEAESDKFRAGILFGNEFIMGEFRFGQQIGAYLYKGYSAPNLIFQNYYINYRLSKYLLIGTHLKVHGRKAEYININVGYLF